MQNNYQHSIFSADQVTILFLFMQKLRKRWRTVRWRQYWKETEISAAPRALKAREGLYFSQFS